MNDELVDIVMNIHKFNQDLTDLNIKQAETIEEQKQEIERLNNVINELEREINIAIKELQPNELVNGINLLKNIKFTLQELKGSNNNE